MAFEPVYTPVTASYPARLATGQAVIEARLLPSGFEVSKVLSASADVSLNPGEVFTGEARYSGKATFRVLVLDTEGGCRSLDYVAEFSDKLAGDGITAQTQPVLYGSVLDTDIVLASAQEIKLACVVEVGLHAAVREELRLLTATGEGIYTHDDNLVFGTLTADVRESHAFSDSVTLDAADEILFCEPRVCIIKRNAGSDTVSADGAIITFITARSGGGLVSVRHETPISVELSALGAHPDDTVNVSAEIKSARAELVGGEGSSAVALDYTVEFACQAYSEDEINPVCDAFSVNNELLVSGESENIVLPLAEDTFFESVEGKVRLDENMPAADRIAAVTGARLNITSAAAGEGKLTVEGMATSSVIYNSEDGQTSSAAVEMPFSITVSAPVKEGDTVSARGIVTDVNVKIRRDGELDIKADIAVEYSASRSELKYVITSIALGEERPEPTGAVAIHIARKGETLWDAAKALGTTPENVLLQNPGVSMPMEGGERVIAYRCLSK